MGMLLDSAKLEMQQRTHRIQILPIIVVYLNNVCDSRCGTCAIWKNNDALTNPIERQMSDALLRELYGSIGKWHPRQILLSGGEPALHPRFPEAIRTFAATSTVCVISNGLLLNAYNSAQLAGVAEFYLSYDAPDRESYQRIRGVDGFERLRQTVQRLHSLHSRPKRPKIIARCTVQRANAAYLPDLVRTAQAMGFDRISFLGVDASSQAFSRNLHGEPDWEAIVPAAGELRAMEEGIESLDGMDGGFIEGGIAKLAKILQYFRALRNQAAFPVVQCNAPWVSMVVETTGKIRGCFFQPIIGDLRSLNGGTAVSFRQSLDVSTDPTCRRCVCSKQLKTREFARMSL